MWKMKSTGDHCEPGENVSAEGSLTVGEQQTGRPLDREIPLI